MKKCLYKIVFIIIILIGILLVIQTKSNAAVSMSISSSNEVAPNGSFKVTISVKGGAGYVNISASNGTISSKREWIDNSSITLNCVAGNSGEVVIKADGLIGDYETEEDVKKSTSTRTKIKVPQPTETKPQTPETPTTNKTTTTKTENKKAEKVKEKVVETKEKEEATPELGIHFLKLIGIKENGEEVEVSLDKEFNIKTFDYSCNVANDIKTLKIEKEAYEYNDLVQISGLDEELKIGENIITLKLASNGKEVTYTIKVTKEEKVDTDETRLISAEPEERKEILVSIPLIWFILLEVLIVTISVGITVFIMNYLKLRRTQ